MSKILPSALIHKLNTQFGLEQELFIEAHEEGEKITSVRLNPFKPAAVFETEEQVPWCRYGKYLKERPSFIADPLFHAGCYYVQEASSMFLEHALRTTADLSRQLRVLDLCAAPGGKSTLLASLLSSESLLVSNEIIKSRVPVLSDNLTKWGILNSVVSNNDPKDFSRLKGFFDVMVIDAPCSGSGMFRKDPETMQQWSEANVQLCSERQQRILADSYTALKEEGILIYSTCSYSIEENEQIADWLCGEFGLSSIQIPLKEDWGIVETISEKHHCYGYRFYPHKVKGEGFFIACFKKNEGSENSPSFRYKAPKIERTAVESIKNWLSPKCNYSLIPVKDGFSAINKEHEAEVQYLQSQLYLKKSGTFMGKLAGKDLIPDQELAQSIHLNDQVIRINLSLEDARAYLRKDELSLDIEHRGWALMCYQNFGLGWAKILPNRINNYYPKELRILKEL